MDDSDDVSPTVGEYIFWAQTQGCTITYSVSANAMRLVRIEASSGRYAVIAGLMDDQQMTPATVTQTDRRLGLDSPFLKLPPGPHSGSLH